MTKWFTFETDTQTFDSRNFNVFLSKIDRPLMAPITTIQKSVGKRAGAYLEDNALGVLEISIDLILLSDTQNAHRKDLRLLSQSLYFEREGKLIFSDEPDRHYKAQLTGNMNMDSAAAMGEISITFVCGEPFAYSNTEINTLFNDTTDSLTVFNDGSYKTYPRFRVVPTADVTYIKITNSTTGKHVLLNGTFVAWEVIIIDHEKNLAYKEATGERIMTTVDLSSDFFALQANANTDLTLEPTELSVRIYYTERYL